MRLRREKKGPHLGGTEDLRKLRFQAYPHETFQDKLKVGQFVDVQLDLDLQTKM